MRLSMELHEAAYKVPSPGELAVKLSGRGDRLTKYTVDKLRKDFLTLMKNLKRVKSYQEADRLRQAIGRFRDHYEDIISQIGDEIDAMVRQDKMRKSWEQKVHHGWAKEYKEKQAPIWELRYELVQYPLDIYEIEKKYNRWVTKDEWVTKENLFREFQRKYPKWEKKVKRRAQAAWKWLHEFVDWTERSGLYGGGGEAIPIRYPGSNVRNEKIEGFSVQIHDMTTDGSDEEYLSDFRGGLRYYRQRAQKLMPWLLKYKLPFVLYFKDRARKMGANAAASYGGSRINVNIFGMSGDPKAVAKVLAHEMGHHLIRSYFSGKMQSDWRAFVKGGETKLDLRDVVREMKPDEGEYAFEKRLKKENPIMAIQWDALLDDPKYRGLDLITVSRIRKYLDSGGDPIVKVSGKPITAYAATNPEEAFCEALGLLIGYGPRSLLPEVRVALKALFPTLKIESRSPGGAAVSTSLSRLLQESVW